MTILAPAEVHLFRGIKRTAHVWLLMLRLNRPTGAEEISTLLEIDLETARKHLKSLSSAGLIARTSYRNGYIVAIGGLQMLLPGILLPATVIEDAQATAAEDDLNRGNPAVRRESESESKSKT